MAFAKHKSLLTYCFIVLFFLLLAGVVWIIYDYKIKETEAKKDESLYSVNVVTMPDRQLT